MAIQHPLHFEYDSPYKFSNFYQANNQELVRHLQLSATGNGEQQIFFWGGKGQGKSHLLQACCYSAHLGERSHFYLPLQSNALPDPEIIEGLENSQLVCIDNIDAIAGNTKWEHAFFRFYNRHWELQHHLIMSASKPVALLDYSLPDVKTRLSWGLCLKISGLNDEQQLAALTMKAQAMGLELTTRTANYLLTRCVRDLPSLWNFLDKIDHATLSAQRKPTIPLIKEILQQDQNL
jgi:DnaA family protein